MTTPCHQDLIAAHQKRVADLAMGDSRFVVNREWQPFIDGALPQLILVADNPGAKEHLHGEYLSGRGRAGAMARAFFDGVFGAGSFGRDVIVFNKSGFHTNRTGGLAAMLRKGGGSDAEKVMIGEDMMANGRLIVKLVAALRVPVIFIGSESDNTFSAFRMAFSGGRLGGDSIDIKLFGLDAQSPSHIIPHFSLSCAFRKHSDAAWNRRLDEFIGRWEHVDNLVTDKGNLSSKTLLGLADRTMLTDYLLQVMMGDCAAPAKGSE